MTYLYILKSEAAEEHYIGSSLDPWTKLSEINNSEPLETYASKHRPWKMVALFEIGEGKLSPGQVVTFVKRHQTPKLIENLINPEFVPEGKLVQLVRVSHVRSD
jgi:putative endonuclease